MTELNADLALLENYGQIRPQNVYHRFALKSCGLAGFVNK
jgi:hypothetical protein